MNTRLLALAVAFGLCALGAAPASAQLAPPNAAGAAIGHVHINASDVDAQVRFWKAAGGKIVQREKITMVQFPGIYVLLRKQDNSGGTDGSTVNHIGFSVRDFEASVASWKAAGLTWEPGRNPPDGQGFLVAPDNVRIEIFENRSQSVPMQMNHIHLSVTDVMQAQQWYVQHFGGVAGKRGRFDVANVPGTEITIGKVETLQVPTDGRSVDHIGFEVKNIDAFVAKLQAAGLKTDAAIRNSTNAANLRIVFVTDPWGTKIEITEGLAPPAQVTLNSVRIAAANTVTLAKFYQSAFGMQEVNRIDVPGGPEIFVNFGATVEAAKANATNIPIVIMHRDSDAVKDPIAHVILNVTDMTATVAAVKAAGGSLDGEPRPFRNTGIVIGIAVDPAGNRVELIQRP
jgi:catechol 2,3-dioxygenase-like lactoylglutathione lyase family enzyme